jgi:Prealbumin-like fold domain
MVFSLIHTSDAEIFLSGTDRTRDNVIDLLYGEEKTSGVRDIENTPFSQKSKLSLIGTNDNVEGSLIVTKKVNNEGGGNSQPSDFTINVHGNNPSPSSFPGNSSGTIVKLDMGMYSVTESGPSDYNSTSSMDCSGAVMSIETLKCNLTNTYIKSVVGDN